MIVARRLTALLCVGATAIGCASQFSANPALVPVGPLGQKKLEGRFAYAMPQCGGGCANATFPDVFKGFGTIQPKASEPVTNETSATVTLTVVDERHIKATIHQGRAPMAEQLLAGEMNKDGFFVLERARIYHWFVGPLLWGYEERDARLGLDARGNLLVDMNVGGMVVFLILPFFGNGGPVWYTFDRRAPLVSR